MKKRLERMRELRARIREIADLARNENRELTDDEREEVRAAERELSWLRLEGIGAEDTAPGATLANPYEATRECIASLTGKTVFELSRETAPASTTMTVDDMKAGSLIPITVGDILMPLEEGLIWNKIGVRLPTGCAGDYVWPVVSDSVVASFFDEEEEGTDAKIALDDVAVVRGRLYTGCSETRQSLVNSRGEVENIIRTILPLRCVRAINKVLFSKEKLAKAPAGPLVGLSATTLSALGAKTFRELNQAKARLLGKGYSTEGMCWAMSEGTKALLEATPKDAGSGIMVCENGRVCGLPVYCTHEMGNDIALGDWRFQVISQFGGVSFIVDPYSGKRKDKIEFSLNTEVGTATLRPDAFELLTLPANA